MPTAAEAAVGLVAAFGASEVAGITDVTGLGGGGDDGPPSQGDAGPPVDLSGLRADVAALSGRVAAGGAAGGGGGGASDAALASAFSALGEVAAGANAAAGGPTPSDVAEAFQDGARTGATNAFAETAPLVGSSGFGGVGGLGGGGGSGSEPFAGFESDGRTAGENIGSGVGGGAGNVLGYGIESAGEAVMRPFNEQVADLKSTAAEGPNVRADDGTWFPNDPLSNALRSTDLAPGTSSGGSPDQVEVLPGVGIPGSERVVEYTENGGLIGNDGDTSSGDTSSGDVSTRFSDSVRKRVESVGDSPEPTVAETTPEANAGGDPTADPVQVGTAGPDDVVTKRVEKAREYAGDGRGGL